MVFRVSVVSSQAVAANFASVGQEETEFAHAHNAVHVGTGGFWQIGGGDKDPQRVGRDRVGEGNGNVFGGSRLTRADAPPRAGKGA
jgi:hypothetical protein